MYSGKFIISVIYTVIFWFRKQFSLEPWIVQCNMLVGSLLRHLWSAVWLPLRGACGTRSGAWRLGTRSRLHAVL